MTQAISKKIDPIQEIVHTLSAPQMKQQLAMALPKHIDPDRFVRIAMTAVRMSPELAGMDRHSLYAAFIEAAQDGLLPDKKQGAIVPFKGKAKWIPMVAGICQKARQSDQLWTLDAFVVRENDSYENWVDEKGPHFKWVRARENRGKDILTIAYAITKDKAVFIEEIDEDQMAAIERCSQTDKVWKGAFREEMKRKSAIKRLLKYKVPSSSDLQNLMAKDNELYDFSKYSTPIQSEGKKSRLETVLEREKTEDELEREAIQNEEKS
jgi:recombination protein RecT